MLPSSASQSHKANNNSLPLQLIYTQEIPEFEELQALELNDAGARRWLGGGFRTRILAATGAVEKLGQGELNTFVPVEGKDELAMLAFNINRLSSQLRLLLHWQLSLDLF